MNGKLFFREVNQTVLTEYFLSGWDLQNRITPFVAVSFFQYNQNIGYQYLWKILNFFNGAIRENSFSTPNQPSNDKEHLSVRPEWQEALHIYELQQYYVAFSCDK